MFSYSSDFDRHISGASAEKHSRKEIPLKKKCQLVEGRQQMRQVTTVHWLVPTWLEPNRELLIHIQYPHSIGQLRHHHLDIFFLATEDHGLDMAGAKFKAV